MYDCAPVPWADRQMGAEGLMGSDKEARKQFQSLVNDEWRVTRSVATGKAIKEHMEPTYFEILKVCSW